MASITLQVYGTTGTPCYSSNSEDFIERYCSAIKKDKIDVAEAMLEQLSFTSISANELTFLFHECLGKLCDDDQYYYLLQKFQNLPEFKNIKPYDDENESISDLIKMCIEKYIGNNYDDITLLLLTISLDLNALTEEELGEILIQVCDNLKITLIKAILDLCKSRMSDNSFLKFLKQGVDVAECSVHRLVYPSYQESILDTLRKQFPIK